MYCRNCGYELGNDVKFCPNCGAKQIDSTPETVFCKHCGKEIDADCIVCPNCGKQVAELKQSEPIIINNNVSASATVHTDHIVKKCNKWVSLLLCLFLGPLGAHKFYEGKIGTGILYLLTLGFGGIGWAIDLFSILFKPHYYYVVKG